MSCFLSNSSLGKKLVMSVTGCFLVLFILFHMSMNVTAIISPEGYNAICGFLGANWYALAGTVVLAAGVVIHFIYAIILILVMLATNNPTLLGWVARFQRRKAEEKGGADQ